MNRQNFSVIVVVSALVAASCGGSDGFESSQDAGTAAAETTIPTEDSSVSTTTDPAPTTTEVPPPPTPGTGMLPDDTGPELQWIEVATDMRVPPGQLMWTGSSFLIGSHDETGASFLRSADGIDWQPISDLPDGVDWFGIHAAGESIVVWGTDPLAAEATEPAGEGGSDEEGPSHSPQDFRLLASTDGGASWVELDGLGNLGEPSTSPYLRATPGFYAAATSGNIVFVSVETFVDLDVERILTDNGVDPSRLADSRRTDDGMSICLFPVGFDPGDEGFEGDEGDASFEGDAIPADEGDELDEGVEACEGAEGFEVGIEQLDVTFEQLGLDEADITAIDMGSGSFEIFRSLGGGPFEAAEVDLPIPGGWHPAWLRVIDGEFVAAMTSESEDVSESGDTVIYRSADALEWEHGDPISGYVDDVTTDGVSLFARSYSAEGQVLVRSGDRGRTWTEFDVPGIQSDVLWGVFAGPAGSAVLGALVTEPSDVEPRPFLIEKDGYGVNITEDNFLTIVDLATGEIVFELPPDADPADSEFVIVEETSATLLDPDTLEPLLTITASELEEAFEQAFEKRDWPELIIGWSAAGEHWGWQTTTEAFGTNGGAQLAVGDHAVVAMYQGLEPSDASAVRIFTAQVG